MVEHTIGTLNYSRALADLLRHSVTPYDAALRAVVAIVNPLIGRQVTAALAAFEKVPATQPTAVIMAARNAAAWGGGRFTPLDSILLCKRFIVVAIIISQHSYLSNPIEPGSKDNHSGSERFARGAEGHRLAPERKGDIMKVPGISVRIWPVSRHSPTI